MRAITLWQPFASLIACGHKTVETRSWSPPRSLIGERIAIHAAKREPTVDEWYDLRHCWQAAPVRSMPPLGMVVATARLAAAGQVVKVVSGGVVQEGPFEVWRDHVATAVTTDGKVTICHCGDYTPGRWLWLLDEIEPLDKPVPARGYQGLWELDLAA